MAFDKKEATAKAQKIYVEKMKLLGRKQKVFWATEKEAEILKKNLEDIRINNLIKE